MEALKAAREREKDGEVGETMVEGGEMEDDERREREGERERVSG